MRCVLEAAAVTRPTLPRRRLVRFHFDWCNHRVGQGSERYDARHVHAACAWSSWAGTAPAVQRADECDCVRTIDHVIVFKLPY